MYNSWSKWGFERFRYLYLFLFKMGRTVMISSKSKDDFLGNGLIFTLSSGVTVN